jgi:predicted nucleic acid-binding protein
VLVVDASVLVELVLAGRHRTAADRLLDRYAADAELVFVTAAHGLVEATSAVRGLARSGQLTAEQGGAAVAWLSDLHVVLDPSSPRLRRIWELRDRMSAYDAAYAAAAEALEIPLLSTDRPLLKACAQAGIRASHLDDLQP